MTLRFAFTRPDGGVSIVTAMPKEHLELLLGKPGGDGLRRLSDADYHEYVLSRSIPPNATGVTELPEDWDPPADRTFRNAWALNGKAVTVDMTKAREIQKNRLRELRKPLMAELDTAYLLADEIGDVGAKAEIAAKKQALRDVTADPGIAAAKTPEQLIAVVPEAVLVAPQEK